MRGHGGSRIPVFFCLVVALASCQRSSDSDARRRPAQQDKAPVMAGAMASPMAPAMRPGRGRAAAMSPGPARAPAPDDPPASVLPAEAQLPADAETQLARKGLLSFPSRWSGKVHVRQRGRTRLLYLGRRLDIIHTRLNMDRPTELISPYQRCLLVAFGLLEKPRQAVRRMAMIGLGGGALTRFFQIKLPDIVFHSVEIDPVVVAVARRFFGVRDTSGYRSYAMDGRAFLAQAKRPYDIIILDAFDAEASMPRTLASVAFFKLIKQRLQPQGVLITNFLVQDRRIYASVYQTLKSVFPAVMRLPLKRFDSNNVLLIAPADPARMPDPATLSRRVKALGQTFAVDFPLAACLQTRDRDRLPAKGVSLIRETKQAP